MDLEVAEGGCHLEVEEVIAELERHDGGVEEGGAGRGAAVSASVCFLCSDAAPLVGVAGE